MLAPLLAGLILAAAPPSASRTLEDGLELAELKLPRSEAGATEELSAASSAPP